MKTFPLRCIIFLILVNRYDLRANREPNATTVQNPIFFSRKFVSATFLLTAFFLTAISSAATDAVFFWNPTQRIYFVLFSDSDTTEVFVFTLIDPWISDTTEWEKVDTKEKEKEKEKGMKNYHLRETQISTADSVHHHLRHPTMSMRSCYACRCISEISLCLGKTTWPLCQLLKRLENFFPGFSGITLSFYTMTYHWHWMNFSGFHNFNNTSTTASVTCKIHYTDTNRALE